MTSGASRTAATTTPTNAPRPPPGRNSAVASQPTSSPTRFSTRNDSLAALDPGQMGHTVRRKRRRRTDHRLLQHTNRGPTSRPSASERSGGSGDRRADCAADPPHKQPGLLRAPPAPRGAPNALHHRRPLRLRRPWLHHPLGHSPPPPGVARYTENRGRPLDNPPDRASRRGSVHTGGVRRERSAQITRPAVHPRAGDRS